MHVQSPVVASAVLVSAYHLLQWNVEIVKRWSNEIQEAVQSKAGMVQVGIIRTFPSSDVSSSSYSSVRLHHDGGCRPASLAKPSTRRAVAQFHAVALLHGLRSQDRLAVSKLVTSLVRGSVRSPLAQCLLVRYVAQVCVWHCRHIASQRLVNPMRVPGSPALAARRAHCEPDAQTSCVERPVVLQSAYALTTAYAMCLA